MISTLPLRRLVDVLGASTVTLLTAVSDVEVSGPRIFDPADPTDLGAGDLVLGVNVSPADATPLIAAATLASAAAVFLKGDAIDLAAAVETASRAGIALLGVAAGTSWNQLYELARNAVSTAGAADGEQSDETPIRDLFALANAIAAMVGGAVAIEDPRSNLLAYSNLDQPIDEARRETILGRRNPTSWATVLEEGGIPRLLARSTGVVPIIDPGGVASDRLVTLVRAGAEVLGSIWVVRGDKPLDAAASAALTEAVPLAALHLLRHRAFHDFSRRERGAALRLLLEGKPVDADTVSSLGIAGAGPCTVVAFALGIDDDVELSLIRGRAVDLITVACEAFRRRVVCSWIGPTVYALFPSIGDLDRLVQLVGDIRERSSRALGLTMNVGIGTPAPDLGGLRASRDSADAVLRVLAQPTSPPGRVATLDDVRVPSILLSLADLIRDRADLRLPSLRAVREEGSDQARDYLVTMRAFIDAAGDVALVAERLNVHRNTVRYRLHRLKDNYGLDLFDAGQRLIVTLELLAYPESAD